MTHIKKTLLLQQRKPPCRSRREVTRDRRCDWPLASRHHNAAHVVSSPPANSALTRLPSNTIREANPALTAALLIKAPSASHIITCLFLSLPPVFANQLPHAHAQTHTHAQEDIPIRCDARRHTSVHRWISQLNETRPRTHKRGEEPQVALAQSMAARIHVTWHVCEFKREAVISHLPLDANQRFQAAILQNESLVPTDWSNLAGIDSIPLTQHLDSEHD